MLEDKDWLAENLQQFAPFSLGSFWVYGSHSKESLYLKIKLVSWLTQIKPLAPDSMRLLQVASP